MCNALLAEKKLALSMDLTKNNKHYCLPSSSLGVIYGAILANFH